MRHQINKYKKERKRKKEEMGREKKKFNDMPKKISLHEKRKKIVKKCISL